VFHRPNSLRVARAFSDPPMNLVPGTVVAEGVQLQAGPKLAIAAIAAITGLATQGSVTVGLRASALRLQARPGDVALAGDVELAEISGSDTFVHVHTPVGELVAQLTGVHYFDLGTAITLHFSPAQVYVFDATEQLLHAPQAHTQVLQISGAL